MSSQNILRWGGGALCVAVSLWGLPKLFKILSVFNGTVACSEAHAGTLVASVLQAHGVKRIFTLPGGHVSPVVCACEKQNIRVIDVRNEADAVFAADATSRLTGTVGVAVVTAGPGVTNTITAMKNAQMAHSPVLLIGGASPTISRGRGSLQDIEQIGLFQSICKHTVAVSRVCDIVPALRKALQIAASGVPGPVFLELPVDILYPAMELQANMGLLKRMTKAQLTPNDVPKVLVPCEYRGVAAADYVAQLWPSAPVFLPPKKMPAFPVKQVMEYQVKRIFADAWPTPAKGTPDNEILPGGLTLATAGPLPIEKRQASSSQMSKLKKLVREAKNPVVIVGSQTISGVDPRFNQLVQAALLGLGAPVFLSGMARGLMSRDHPYFLRQNRREALEVADVVLLLGVNVDFRLDYGRAFSKKSKIITVNLSAEELTRNTDVMWKPFMQVLADPCQVLLDLGEAPFQSTDIAWVRALKDKEQAKETNNAADGKQPVFGRAELDGQKLVNPVGFFAQWDEAIRSRDDIIYVGDGGDIVGTAAYVVRPPAPRSWLDPGPYGTLGVGAGFALAAKLAEPKKHVILIWGDGSAGYSISEFDAFRRHNTPIIAIVGNDACWTQIVRDQRQILKSEAACNLAYCHYDNIAAGYATDLSTITVLTVKTEEEVPAAIKAALEASEQGKSVLLNILVGKSSFREGSLSV